MPRKRIGRGGAFGTRFAKKIRQPISFTLSRRHHLKLQRAVRRTGWTRADVLAVLIELHADALTRQSLQSS
jgi:hypothetical protein